METTGMPKSASLVSSLFWGNSVVAVLFLHGCCEHTSDAINVTLVFYVFVT
jgi:hypothetical protein